jgi:WhiB family redox-sensing transcriptional regulator
MGGMRKGVTHRAFPSWMSLPVLPDAACTGEDVGLFYGATEDEELQAKRMCAQCPEKLACLRWAMEAKEPAGIWGGLNKNERDKLRRRNRAS